MCKHTLCACIKSTALLLNSLVDLRSDIRYCWGVLWNQHLFSTRDCRPNPNQWLLAAHTAQDSHLTAGASSSTVGFEGRFQRHQQASIDADTTSQLLCLVA